MKEFYNISKITFLIFVVLLVLIGLYGIYGPKALPTNEQISYFPKDGKVERIVDGDTFIIDGGQSIRILGIDADEKDSLCYETAKLRLEDAIGNQTVTLEIGPKDKDVYSRLLRYVFVADENISVTLVREGVVAAEAPYEGGKYDAVHV